MIINDIITESLDTDIVFEIDSDDAFAAVMARFSHVVEWQGDYMRIQRRYWSAVEELAHTAGGEANEIHELNELSFMGSPCTKDCSGHRAGYAWSKARGGKNASSWSQSFDNGAAIAASGR